LPCAETVPVWSDEWQPCKPLPFLLVAKNLRTN
jgi:hypothetical protein